MVSHDERVFCTRLSLCTSVSDLLSATTNFYVVVVTGVFPSCIFMLSFFFLLFFGSTVQCLIIKSFFFLKMLGPLFAILLAGTFNLDYRWMTPTWIEKKADEGLPYGNWNFIMLKRQLQWTSFYCLTNKFQDIEFHCPY